MTDSRLRELERAFIESNAPEDHLAWLRERVRQGESLDWESYSRLAELNVEAASEYLLARVGRGELEQEKLELAAYCSHEPARVALGEEAPEVPEDLEGWALGLEVWHPGLCIRAATIGSRIALSGWLVEHPNDPRPYEALEAIERYLEQPKLTNCDTAFSLALQAANAARESEDGVAFPQLKTRLGLAAASAFLAAVSPSGNRESQGYAVGIRGGVAHWVSQSLTTATAACRQGPEGLRDGIVREFAGQVLYPTQGDQTRRP